MACGRIAVLAGGVLARAVGSRGTLASRPLLACVSVPGPRPLLTATPLTPYTPAAQLSLLPPLHNVQQQHGADRPPLPSPIQASLTAVHSKKRIPRKRTLLGDDSAALKAEETPEMEVVAYSTAEEYDLEDVMKSLQKQNLYNPSAMSEDINDVLHVSGRYTNGDEPREIYLFREGAVVFWNVPEAERRAVLTLLTEHQKGDYHPSTVETESESMPYSYTGVFNKTRLVNGRILLNVEGSTELEKYAFSNAMALSVKLGIWEAALENYIDSVRPVTEELKQGGQISLSKEEVMKKNGELFGLRHLINLSSDCLDTPDFYWDRQNLETLYQKTCNYLNIAKRTRVMNEKLNHCVELAELLSSSLTDRHHVRLERMVIALIAVNVLFDLIHFLERHT